MNPPTSRKEARHFIGVLNYYRNIWARISHTLVHLTKITPSKVQFKWTKMEQDAFNKIKRIVAHNNLLAYPDFNDEFKSTPMLAISN